MKRKIFLTLVAAAVTSMVAGVPAAQAADPVKIGFLVKQPEEPWFQDEWKFAEMAAKKDGFTLVKIGATSGEKVMSAIDNLSAQKAQGFIICTPDVKLGPGIVAKAKADGLKMMTVDDRLVDGAGKPIASVPHMGISAYNIGQQVGKGLVDEIKKRGWDMKDVGVIDVTYEQLPTAHDRTQGATDVLVAAHFPKANIIAAPQAKTDTENAFNAANIAHYEEPAVQALGGVRPERRSRARRRARSRRPWLQGRQHDRHRHRRFGFGNERIQEAASDGLLRHGHHQPEASWRRNVGRYVQVDHGRHAAARADADDGDARHARQRREGA